MKDLDTSLETEFWSRLGHAGAGMLGVKGDRILPMTGFADRNARCLWFITAQGTDADAAAISKIETDFTVSDGHARIHTRIRGRLSEARDPAKLDDLWNAFAGSWFPGGRDDATVRLLRFAPIEAEVWLTDGSARFLWDVARSRVTNRTPEGGEHGVIQF